MSNFVTDLTTLPDGKSDLTVIPVPDANKVIATEWNTVMQGLYDLRGQLLTGNYHGLTNTTTTQSVSPASKLKLRLNGTNLEASIDGGAYYVLSSKVPEVFNPLTYGAKFDGVTDDSAAFKAMFAAIAATGRQQRVSLPSGTTTHSVPLHITWPVVMKGAGSNTVGGTLFDFAANQHGIIIDSGYSTPLFSAVYEAGSSSLSDFWVRGNYGAKYKHGIMLRVKAKLENIRVEQFTGNGFCVSSADDGNSTDTNALWKPSTVYTDGDWVLGRGKNVGAVDTVTGTLALSLYGIGTDGTDVTITRSTNWDFTPTVGMMLEIPEGSPLAGTAISTGSTGTGSGNQYDSSYGITLNTPISGLQIGDGLQFMGMRVRVEAISANGLSVYTDKQPPGGSGQVVYYAANVNAGTYRVSAPITSTTLTAYRLDMSSEERRSGDYLIRARAIVATSQVAATDVTVTKRMNGRFLCVTGGTSSAVGSGPTEGVGNWPSGYISDGTVSWKGGATGPIATFNNATSSGTTITVSGGVTAALIGGVVKVLSGTGTLSTFTSVVTGTTGSTQFTISETPSVALSGTNQIAVYGSGTSNGNANNFYWGFCVSNFNLENGFYSNGDESNIGTGIQLDASVNAGWGIYDNSFLGCVWMSCHASNNSQGPVRNALHGNCYSTFIGQYTESGQGTGEMLFPPATSVGGIHAAGFHTRNTAFTLVSGSLSTHATTVYGGSSGTTHSTTVGYLSAAINVYGGIQFAHSTDPGMTMGNFNIGRQAYSLGALINNSESIAIYGAGSVYSNQIALNGFRFYTGGPGTKGNGLGNSPAVVAVNGNPAGSTSFGGNFDNGDILFNQDRQPNEAAFWSAPRRAGSGVPWTATNVVYGRVSITPTTPNGYLYVRTGGGNTTGPVEPGTGALIGTPWPTVIGNTVSDGGVTWTCWCLIANTLDAVYPIGIIPDDTGTPGAATQNTRAGRVRIAATNSSVVVTNSLVRNTAPVTIIGTAIQTNDATLTFVKSVVNASGSFTINCNAVATAAVDIAWWIVE